MPHSPDKASDPLAGLPDLPNPELNPLLNPILGRHLGRWAQVYFTTPSERRDEAIYDLLRELKTEEEAGTGADADSTASSSPDPTVLICERCNHHHTRLQNFCGMCGAPLLPGMVAEPEPRITEAVESAPAETMLTAPIYPERPAREPVLSKPPVEHERFVEEETQELNLEGLLTPGLLFDPRQSGTERREPARDMPRAEAPRATTHSMIYADDPPAAIAEPLPSFREQRPERRSAEREPDIEWLRERQFAREIGGESSGAWKVVAVLGVLVALGALAYFRLEILRPLRSAISPAASQATASQASPQGAAPTAQTTPEPLAEEPAASAADNRPKPAAPRSSVTSAAKAASSETTPRVSQGTEKSAGKIQNVGAAENHAAPAATSAPQSSADLDSGTNELALAEKLLSGSGGTRNSAAAASLLWKAVGKQNTTAILLLSDLYATGDGVPKSCDQARLLLDAALRKGTPGAANRLQNLQGSCR